MGCAGGRTRQLNKSCMATTADFTKGFVIIHNGEPNIITEVQFVSPGKGSAFVRTRLKNLKTGKVIEFTFKSGERVEEANVTRQNMQYLYGDTKEAVFMNNQTYEQVSLMAAVVGEDMKYLKEGMEAMIILQDGNPIALEIPKKITFKVISAPPGVRGDTASNTFKEVILENNITVRAPLFIKEGELVVVNTETGEYVERANE